MAWPERGGGNFGSRCFGSEAERLVAVDHAPELATNLRGQLHEFIRFVYTYVTAFLGRFQPMKRLLKFSIRVRKFG